MNTLIKLGLAAFAVLFVLATPMAARADVSVTVYAASWCGFCKKFRADLVQETGTEKLIAVDGVNAPVTWIDATKNKSIRGYPTVRIASEDGKLKEEIIGYYPNEIRAAIARVRAGIGKSVEPAKPSVKASTAKPAAKKKAPAPKAKNADDHQRYFQWMTYEGSDDQYCFETDELGELLDANESPVEPGVCDEADANTANLN